MAEKVTLQRGSNMISVEGDVAFIQSTLESWKYLLDTAEEKVATASPATPPTKVVGSDIEAFENVFDTVDGKLKIIHSIPGPNKAEKTRNTALVILYGHYLQGSEQIPSELIREACVDQGCFDPSNYAAHMKALKEKVAMNTKPSGGYDVKLTAPGRKAAKDFVENLNSANS